LAVYHIKIGESDVAERLRVCDVLWSVAEQNMGGATLGA